MAADLDELHERIAYTKVETSALAAEVQAFFDEYVHFRLEQTGNAVQAFLRTDRAVPTKLKAKAGMIANELRSTLDGLACTLAQRNGKTPAGTYFPISKSEEIFNDDGMQKMRKLSTADQQKIVELHPYRGGNEMLFGLHEADRTRKHQRLIASASRSTTLHIPGFGMFTGGTTMIGCMVNGQPIPYLNFEPVELLPGADQLVATAIGPQTDWGIETHITYEEPDELKGKSVVGSLMDFAQTVEQVVSLFD